MDDIEKSFVERRGWPRSIIDRLVTEAQLLLPAHLQENPPAAEVVNLSVSGAGVLIPIRLEKGTQVKLQIMGKDVPSLELKAEVRWAARSPVSTGKYPAGLKFLPLESERQTALQAFIDAMRKHRPTSK